mgnify:CR=1 FL=1
MSILRRTCSLIIALAFVLGMLVQAPALYAGSAMTDMAVASGTGHPGGACDHCDDQDMSVVSCASICPAPTVILATDPGLAVLPPAALTAAAAAPLTGQSGPPDPYPPRSLILG